jgi:PKD repeat protein
MKHYTGKLAVKNTILIAFLLIAASLHAQDWKEAANRSYLLQLSDELNKTYLENQSSVQTYALERNILVREKLDDGRTISLIRIMPSGLPEYYMTHNLRASQNVGTARLRPRANLSLNLTGKNMLIGVWDSGSTNVEHQEFGNRVTIKDNIPFDNHGTHVAGTIAAAGVNPQARGMAYESRIFAYEFNNDNAEMASEAAQGLIISNHSYGLRTGWDVNASGTGWQWFGDPSVSNVQDYRFGFYDAANSRVWDDISFNAPYYLIVKSAGNDRTDVGDGTRPPDGPYDCLEPKSVAKNILTIGAVEHLTGNYTGPNDVVMSAFSSWGPTDDGRIKPDLSAIGVDVFSSLSTGVNAYGLLSGTSMSAPNTTGSLALLQEYYAQLYSGNYMRSATLKALAIHTVNEAGANPGPDYEYGWGLLAVDKAANVITRNDGINFMIKELNLRENDSIVFKVNSNGTAPLAATICWTDVPGSPAPISLNPTRLMLVNDLDMRIYDENNNVFMPWILNPANPIAAATKGDNFRDNVEKIEIPTPAAGEYTIVIKHKNELRNRNQNFSLVVSTASLDLNLSTFYWIGGSGDWNNPANWSLSSGGSVANAVPGINNPVIFDNNSFSGAVNSINLTSQANCYSINYYTTDSCAINLAAFTINIDGSVFDENNKLSFNNGRISFKGIISKNNQIRLGVNSFINTDLEFISENGSWNFVNNFNARNLTIQNSSIYAQSKQVNITNITAAQSISNTINFSGSVINGLNIINVSGAPQIIFNNSLIKFSNENGVLNKTIIANGSTFNNVELENANLTINGNNKFNEIRVNGNMIFTGANTMERLTLSTASTLTLSDGTTQTINTAFEAIGTTDNLIEIQSTGGSIASLFADNPNVRFCLDYLDVMNVSVSGRTGFLSGDHSNIDANSTGWIELDCNDALFPSFDIQYPCALGETRFIDTSTGFPTSWSWNFGDLQFPQTNTSSLQNPFHNFKFEGDYVITYNVKNNQFDETITRTVSIINYESGLGIPGISVNGSRLSTSAIAPNYQWYLNNNPIPGATDRIFEIGNPGTYYVTVSDENCLFRSEATVVTALDDELKTDNLSIYPNPSRGEFTLELTNNYTGKMHLTLYDLLGNQLRRETVEKSSGHMRKEIVLRQLPNGIYHLVIEQNSQRTVRKIVIAD